MGMFGYIISLLFPAIALFGLWTGGWSTALFPLVGFVFVPFVELFIKGRGTDSDDLVAHHGLIQDIVLLMGFCMAWAGWAVLVHQLSQPITDVWNFVGMVVCAGVLFGALGINIAHELGHRREKVFQRLAKALLILSLYMHFFIEHNRGHHSRVATPEDPATSQYNTTVF